MNLGARYWRFSSKAAWLSEAFTASLITGQQCDRSHSLGRENAVVQLQDQWNAFCRELILGSWKGGVITSSGNVIPLRGGRRSQHAALLALRSTYSGRLKKSSRWEPKWFDANESIEAASRLSIPNAPEVIAGIGLTPSPLDELRAVRNFIAHKGDQSAGMVKAYIPDPSSEAVDAYMVASTIGGAVRFERWVSQLDIMARGAVL